MPAESNAMNNGITVTREMIERFQTSGNGYTRSTLKLFGVSWPPRKGWKRALIGSQIPLDNWKALTAQKELFPGEQAEPEASVSPHEESRAERCQRVLSGNIALRVKPASELHFDFDRATAIAQQSNHNPKENPR